MRKNVDSTEKIKKKKNSKKEGGEKNYSKWLQRELERRHDKEM